VDSYSPLGWKWTFVVVRLMAGQLFRYFWAEMNPQIVVLGNPKMQLSQQRDIHQNVYSKSTKTQLKPRISRGEQKPKTIMKKFPPKKISTMKKAH
jgi:hypothetical protein